MAKDKVKISNNNVDSTPPLFANPADPKTLTIDPRNLRYSNSISRSPFAFQPLPGGDDGDPPPPPPPPGIGKYVPQLSDISIVSETFDYSTTPVTIRLKLKIVNGTGEVVKGIKGRVPPL